MKLTLLTAAADDLSVVNAARVSFDQQSEWQVIPDEAGLDLHLKDSDAGLLGFLLRNRHGTPFEHGYFRFHVEAPIFVFREWHRHRIGHSYNEMSGRYVKLEEKFYWPDAWRVQHGKPGAYTFEPMPPDWEGASTAAEWYETAYGVAWDAYEGLLALGVAKEQARAVLPVGLYSQMYWSCNPRSLMHFLSLRNEKHAMKEIRDLAAAAEEHFVAQMPVTAQAFIDNGRKAP